MSLLRLGYIKTTVTSNLSVSLALPFFLWLSLSWRHLCTLDIVFGLTHSWVPWRETTPHVMRPPCEEAHMTRDRGLLTTTWVSSQWIPHCPRQAFGWDCSLVNSKAATTRDFKPEIPAKLYPDSSLTEELSCSCFKPLNLGAIFHAAIYK